MLNLFGEMRAVLLAAHDARRVPPLHRSALIVAAPRISASQSATVILKTAVSRSGNKLSPQPANVTSPSPHPLLSSPSPLLTLSSLLRRSSRLGCLKTLPSRPPARPCLTICQLQMFSSSSSSMRRPAVLQKWAGMKNNEMPGVLETAAQRSSVSSRSHKTAVCGSGGHRCHYTRRLASISCDSS